MHPPKSDGRGYFPALALPAWFKDQDQVTPVLFAVFAKTWMDIDPGAQEPVEGAYHQVLDALSRGEDPTRTHHRFVRMALILALASQAWIRKYTPEDTRASALTDEVTRWLLTGAPLGSPSGPALYPVVATRHQHLDEQREVHRCLSWMPSDPDRCPSLLLDILDLTLTGYAIHPGGGPARRDLFNWWLSQAIPATVFDRLPDHIYSGDWPWPPRASGGQTAEGEVS